jgi:ribonuclease BN (tRNA processing enzyme)
MIDKMIFLGSGSAFTMKNRQSNAILIDSENKKSLLIDCGTDIRHSLAKINYSHRDISAVYISHAHADHAGGLEWLGFCSYFVPIVKSARGWKSGVCPGFVG